jgi:hypothetical protein
MRCIRRLLSDGPVCAQRLVVIWLAQPEEVFAPVSPLVHRIWAVKRWLSRGDPDELIAPTAISR